jgi:prepilin-type N-terminal cleavage/methylation domain-containing protein
MNPTRPSPAPRSRPGGFTLLEVLIVSGLMTVLVMVLSGAWSGLGRPSSDAIIQARIAHEASLALHSLARDFSGTLAEEAAGGRRVGRLVGRLVVEGSELWLCYDGGSAGGLAAWGPPDTVIIYQVQDNQLVRTNWSAGTSFTVAAKVDQMQVTAQADGVRIDLTFRYRDLTRTYTLIGKDP